MFDLTQLIVAIVGLIVTAVGLYLIPAIKARYSADAIKQAQVVIAAIVKGAEMIFNGDGRGAEKKAYVQKKIEEYLKQNHLKIDLNIIEDLIESAVLDMKAELNK